MPDSTYDIPVALIVFNRPDVTQRVFDEIAKRRPRQLFIIADGARVDRVGEAARVAQTRAIVDAVDWPCEVHRNFAEANMGCKRRVSSGINWVFEHVERAVILEDDCLPAPGFFTFCEEMLLRYEGDQRVFSIAGSNFGPDGALPGHYFSRYALMWGWATWRDRWQQYQLVPNDYLTVLTRTWWRRPVVFAYWRQICIRILSGALDTWDIQWILTVWRNGGLVCRPSQNLIENLGFGEDATHTNNANSSLAQLKTASTDLNLSQALTGIAADPQRDKIDEDRWALINWRSVLLMSWPRLAKLKAALS